jgi:rare lipoprotein A
VVRRILLAAFALALVMSPARAQHGLSADDVVQVLRASWYDCRKAGECSASKRTASGERFNPQGLTAAHRTLPLGTRLRICHGNVCTVCRVNDRGPARWTGKDIDLSLGCARAIGFRAGRVAISKVN